MLKLVILFTLVAISAAEKNYLVTAPNIFRANVEEDVYVSIFGTGKVIISVTVRLTNSLDELVASQSVNVKAGTPGIVKLLVDPSTLNEHDEIPSINVKVSSTNPAFQFQDTAVALVTTKNQIVFLQTDKPIYTPDQDVKINVISLNEEMKPTNREVRLDIVTPTGAVIQREERLSTQSGYISKVFQFSSYPSYGIWSVIASYGQNNEWNSTTEFELREYVLPTFKIKIEGQKEILLTDNNLLATVTARYVDNTHVQGTVYLEMKLKTARGQIIGVFPAETKVLNALGQAAFEINPSETYGENWFQKFVNNFLYIEAVVTDRRTGDQKNTSISTAKLVHSVYIFKRDRTISHFKKGTKFDIKVDLIHFDGSPGADVLCEVDAYGINSDGIRTKLTSHKDFHFEVTSNSLGQVDFQVDVNQDTEEIAVEIKSLDSNYLEIVQKPYTFKLYPIESINEAYLKLLVPPGEIEIADNYEVDVVKSGRAEVRGLNFIIVSKGKILQTSSDIGYELGSQKTIRINVTKDMVPSARLIVYSFAGNEVVADSVLLDIVEECKSELTINLDDDTVRPRDNVDITIIGEPGSVVNLLAVDEAVYFLKDFQRLTEKKMFQRMETLDLGCGPGGGANSMEIFENAGMLSMSSAKLSSRATKTDIRRGYGCPTMTNRRKKRDLNAFAEIEVYKRFVGTTRTYFPETWINFFKETIPDNGKLQVSFTVPDSITNWIVQASSISASMGMCVANENKIKVKKDVFLALKMPHLIVRGKQTQVQATLFNYGSYPLTANVYMYGTENVCSESLPGERGNAVHLNILANNEKSTMFNILPLEVGSYIIDVKAFTNFGNDTIRKRITVVHEGVGRHHTYTSLFDPSGEQAVVSELRDTIEHDAPLNCLHDTDNGIQTCTIDVSVPNVDVIPGTEQCYITFFGDLILPVVSSLIIEFDPSRLLSSSKGDGEATMMQMSANVYTMLYLSNTGDRVDAEVEAEGYRFISQSYNRMISFQVKGTGGFAVFTQRPPNTWLTAYTIRVFYQVLKLGGFVDEAKLCDAYAFLADRYRDIQGNQGIFYEVYNVVRRDLPGGIQGDIMMTAFVVITILGSNPANLGMPDCRVDYSVKVDRAINYLEARIDTLETPYARAVVSYALTIAGSDKANELWAYLKNESSFDGHKNVRYWSMEQDTLTMEATSYGLLTALQRNEILYASGLVNWLKIVGDYRRGWSTTSSTGIALEALATYAMKTATTPVNMECKVTYTENAIEHVVIIDEQNKDLSQRIPCTTNGIAVIKCSGNGVAEAQVEVLYNSPVYNSMVSSSEAECEFFINVEMIENEANPVDNGTHTLVINTKYRLLNNRTNMVIVEAGLISGFAPVKDTLEALVNNLEQVERYVISDGKVVLYLSSLTSEITTLRFEVSEDFLIVNPQQAAQVTIYNYFSPERNCTTFYSPFKYQTKLEKFCVDGVCRCAAGACPHCIKISNRILENSKNETIPSGRELYNEYACGVGSDKTIDYVFEVIVLGYVEKSGFLELTTYVTTVMKMGADTFEDKIGPNDLSVRKFAMKTSCTLCKEWKVGKKYLIMGKDGIRYKPEGSNKYLYKYLLDRTSYIEEWSKRSVNKKRLKVLSHLKKKLLHFGCPFQN